MQSDFSLRQGQGTSTLVCRNKSVINGFPAGNRQASANRYSVIRFYESGWNWPVWFFIIIIMLRPPGEGWRQ